MAINLNIPTNAYSSSSSYSGLGQNWQPWSAQTAQPVISNLLNNWQGNVNSQFSQGLGNVAQNQLNPALQDTINSLQSRGILNSSVAGDTLRGTSSDIINKLLESQVGFQGQSALATQAEQATGSRRESATRNHTLPPCRSYC